MTTTATRTDRFPVLTVETAPERIRPTLQGVHQKFGGLPPAVATMANAPELLEAFLSASALFERCSLTPLQRETLVLTVAVRNGCHVCVQLHSMTLQRIGAAQALIESLASGDPVDDAELAALQRFVHAVMDSAGAVPDAALADFTAYGYTAAQALEVVLGIGAYTLSTLANRMTGAGL